MMNCLLANGGVSVPETFTTNGMTNLLFRGPALDVPNVADALRATSAAAGLWFEDFELGEAGELIATFPGQAPLIRRLAR